MWVYLLAREQLAERDPHRVARKMHKHSEEYDGLLNSSLTRSSLEFEDSECKGSQTITGAYKSSSRPVRRPLLPYVIACLVFVALTDIVFLAYISRVFTTEYLDDADLPLAYPYIGLKELYDFGHVEPPRFAPLLNKPRVVTQVFRDEPERPGGRGEHQIWDVEMGQIFPPFDKHLLVNDKTRTIIQFRAMDFGMEECSLAFRFPGTQDLFEGKDLPAVSSATIQLQICPLDVPRFLDVRAVSWASRPQCAGPPTMFTAAVGAEHEVPVPRFPCAWGTYHSFEVACTDEDGSGREDACAVDVWSSHNQTWGLYMYQHQTI
ncbi:uncharacterized protein B0H18DRAFT_1005875 [Fomitopsis serialis]|uniref:uncharacterized protein n=1 Tax=Fomitopsis serialis TaxID=139415 RepID=UPI002008D886|nr:uncharacterized protein B0H18DRAFT_1005875 [Neoantrodia serialis]KAH9926395.1 hypothetical protein B0H18DRAFT_1005875 [Neoantrodia serialis]